MTEDVDNDPPARPIQPVPPELLGRAADGSSDTPIDTPTDEGRPEGDRSGTATQPIQPIQPVPPELLGLAADGPIDTPTDTPTDAGRREDDRSGTVTQPIQPVPPEFAQRDVIASSAEFEVISQDQDQPAPRPSSATLYDVPWKAGDEPIPEWIADTEPDRTESVRSTDRPGSGRATAVAPVSRGVGDPSVYEPRPLDRRGSSNRPRRAGLIAAAVAAMAIIAVGGGVLALLVARGNGASESGGTIPSVIEETIAVPTSGPMVTDASAPPPTAAPSPTTPPTAATSPAPTPPAPTTQPPAVTPNTVPGDLDLAEPMRRPACDGQFIVIVANAVTPGEYQRQVVEAQQRFVGAAYLKTDQTCPSLRPFDDVGNAIYSIYYGPFPTLADACGIQAQVGGDSYIKVLDQVTPFTKIWDC